MKRAQKRRNNTSKPKHKQTKEYLKHYHPYIPLFISLAILVIVIFAPMLRKPGVVLPYNSKIYIKTLADASNQERTKNDGPKLVIDDKLNKAAQYKAEDMVSSDYWSHKTPEGLEPWAFIKKAGYSYDMAGENLAYGFNSSESVVDGWINSIEHRENLLSGSFTEVGYGVAKSDNFIGQGPTTVVVAMYAKPNKKSAVLGANSVNYSDNSRQVTNMLSLTGSYGAVYSLILIVAIAIMYIFLTHSLALKRSLLKSEQYIAKRPLFDSMVILVIAVGIILLRSSGSIL